MKLNHKIILFLSCSLLALNSCSKDDSPSDVAPVDNSATIKTFTDVTFSLDPAEGFNATRFFSTELGKSYKKAAIDAAILPKIDIVFTSGSSSLNYFTSPSNSEYGIKNGTTTMYINYQKDDLTVEQFNKIDKSSDFDAVKIAADDNNSFTDSNVPHIVLFKNAAGKKGAIYVKSVHRIGGDPRIVVDIKIQK